MKITIIIIVHECKAYSELAMCNLEYNYIRPCQVTQKELMTRELMTKILYPSIYQPWPFVDISL